MYSLPFDDLVNPEHQIVIPFLVKGDGVKRDETLKMLLHHSICHVLSKSELCGRK
uniref:Uncharacterized protein n=1 Tax=Melanopsichium pennsylvanicum 4 TaxID=1398559 RepID=A0A077QZZ2_9BASI|nr:uncharacterized protein BN887_06052 [Melanopsichium pennsylvanicum 4]